MTPVEKYSHWKSYAERDLDAAQAMFETGRWFYVLFMCQQAVEKLIKGIYNLYVENDVPRTHNIEMNTLHNLRNVNVLMFDLNGKSRIIRNEKINAR